MKCNCHNKHFNLKHKLEKCTLSDASFILYTKEEHKGN